MNENEFYRKLHPDMFSDSRIIKKGILSEEFFSYFLDTLTSQSKEKEFETFCRKLLEVTVCPNLLPQTGPTGGGDSKVDSETYPVSEFLSEGWLIGYSDAAHTDRWAFAMSAKKDWRSKYKSDIKKIIKVNEEKGRNYTKVYFLTNQFVSDKKRAELEDESRELYHLDFRILDKSWIMDNTFKSNNVDIAIEAFHMSDQLKDEKEIGLQDQKRKKRLEEIDIKLGDTSKLKDKIIVTLSKESIELMRELESEKSVAIDYLERNLRLANKYGSIIDKVIALYDYSWTMMFWYEDRDKFYELYIEIENIFKDNKDNYFILNKLFTLWITLNSNHQFGVKEIDSIDEHTKLLEDEFQVFIEDKDNPKRGLNALYDYQKLRITDPNSWENIIETYISILDDFSYNIDIDLNGLKRILELPILKDFPKYDELFERLIVLLGEQSKNSTASELLINRGNDFVENDVYKALNLYSRSLNMLYQKDLREPLVRTLMSIGTVLESVDLLWAARGAYIRALVYSSNLYLDDNSIIPYLFLSARRLKRLELQLGNIPNSLQFNKIELFAISLYPRELNEDKEIDIYTEYDALLSVALLNINFDNLKYFERLPDLLTDYNLDVSSTALKYCFGHYDKDYIEALGSKEEADEFMKDLFNQPASKNFFKCLDTNYDNDFTILKSKICGCIVSVKTSRNILSYEFAASLLATLENVFATTQSEGIYTFLSDYHYEIHLNDSEEFGINYEQDNNYMNVTINKIEEITEYRFREKIHDVLSELMAFFSAQMLSYNTEFEKMKKVMEEENAIFRSMVCANTLDTFIPLDDNYSSILELTKEYSKYTQTLKESVFVHNSEEETVDKSEYKKAENNDDLDSDTFNFSKVTHRNIKMSDIIYLPLWDKAGWKAVSAMGYIRGEELVFALGLIFENKEGIEIFTKWKKEGKGDRVCIGIITGIDKENPYWYRVIVGENINDKTFKFSDDDYSLFNNLTRYHTMEAKDDYNINIIKDLKSKCSEYQLFPAMIEDLKERDFKFEYGIHKKMNSLIVKDVSEIEESDMFLLFGLAPTDNPINNTGKELYAEKIIKKKRNREFIVGKPE